MVSSKNFLFKRDNLLNQGEFVQNSLTSLENDEFFGKLVWNERLDIRLDIFCLIN